MLGTAAEHVLTIALGQAFQKGHRGVRKFRVSGCQGWKDIVRSKGLSNKHDFPVRENWSVPLAEGPIYFKTYVNV